MREYKIWDNGNKCTIINEYMDEGDLDFDFLIGDGEPFGILSCNLRDYSLEWRNGLMKTTQDVFEWVMDDKKIKSFNFTGKDLIEGYGTDNYYDDNGEEVELDAEKDYSVEELKNLIMLMYENDCFEDCDLYNILNKTEFENFIIRPFYAYIHSGISISLGDFNDPWDSGVAGLTWYEPYKDEKEVEKHFEEDFDLYDDFIRGYYNEYHICTYVKQNNEWMLDDDYWNYLQSMEEAWDCLDFDIKDEVKNFSEEDKDLVRKEIIINDKEVVDYLEDYLG